MTDKERLWQKLNKYGDICTLCQFKTNERCEKADIDWDEVWCKNYKMKMAVKFKYEG